MKTIPKLGLIVILFLFTGLFSSSFAQSHNVKALGCKYYQKGPDVAHSARVNTYEVCNVCEDKKEKERIAKLAEDKRRNDVLIAKQKAEAAERVRKEKAEAEERERKEKERIAYEAAEKLRKEESAARIRQESEVAKRRANEIQSRYKELANVRGVESVEEIEGLEAYNDKEYFGVKYNGDFLWRKPNDNLPVQLRKIIGMNYFVAKNGSKEKLYDMYGTTLLVDGEEWFDKVTFDQEKNIIKFEIIDESFYNVSSKGLSSSNIPSANFYTSKEEILSVHNQLYEIQETKRKRIKEEEERERAAKSKNESSDEQYIRVTLVVPPTRDRELQVAKGKLIATDLRLKILEKNSGYFIQYY
ncbi:hypothetical protein PZ892_08240 [Sphingobacterium sp. WM]|uniref:hypothetical protein n=1 Tax=Sphingobacterium sp. WM TaxID=3031802 RepID=UPI00240D3AC2|nr:hypothetical protein [Sphingobacterium sp. WM]WFB65196.1 hypothetical protein PZ892_08240 [Sphingobacterium sp. WM]